MEIKKKLRTLKKNPWILLLWNEHRRIKGNYELKKLSDVEYINKIYYKSFNRYPNLDDPKTYNEKLQWLKLNYRKPIMTTCADKYEVRQYLIDKGYKDLLNNLIAVYDSVDEIKINELPKRFVIKASHGSGWNLIVRDKDKVNWYVWKLIMKSWLKQNLYNYGREWPYKNMKPRIICEKFLEDSKGELLDYKFYCFNGEPKLIQVDIDRFNEHTMNYYDIEWNYADIQLGYGKSNRIIQTPKNLRDMIKISKDLSKEFPHVRVDFYEVDGKLYFGELTFFSGSGTAKFNEEKYDETLGQWINI